MVNGTTDEDSVGELSKLDGHDWFKMPLITNGSVEGEKLVNQLGDINRSNDITNERGGKFGVMELNASIVASYVDGTVGVGVKTTGEGREKRQRFGEGLFEKGKE